MTEAAINTIYYTCGHMEEVDLSDIAEKDRERRATWLSTRACTHCWKASSEAEVAGKYSTAETEVEYACGHTATLTLDVKKSGEAWTPRGRAWFVDKMAEEGECTACWKTHQPKAAAGGATEEQLTDFEEKTGLPNLDGTEKQISFARSVRFHTFTVLDGTEWELASFGPEMEEAIDLACDATDAKWWLDARESLAATGTLNEVADLIRAGLDSGDAGIPTQAPAIVD